MNKVIMALIIIIVILSAIIFGIYIYNRIIIQKKAEIRTTEQNSNKISSEIVIENLNQVNNAINTNSNEKKISPNAVLKLKTNYLKCGHSVIDNHKIDESLVNKTQSELEAVYFEYNVEKFDTEEIILVTNKDTMCGEHYVVKNVDGFLEIYKMIENNEEILYEKTEIAIDYLTEADKLSIEQGLFIEGKEALNLLLEDYGS